VDKAPDAFRTISEVAEDLDLPQHVLRFWETRFAQIKPMKRGGGRRYYRPEDVDVLRGIRHLLYSEGYTIRGVQRIFKDHGVKFVQTVWQAGAPQPAKAPSDVEDAEVQAGEPEPAESGRRLFGILPLLSEREGGATVEPS
jgi:DNA-binding transcriptional MerR regulator